MRVTAAWEKRTENPGLDARHDLTAEQFEKIIAELKNRESTR